MGKRVFPPLPTRPQLMVVYPALFSFLSFLRFAEVSGGSFFFSCVREGDNVVFACDEESERPLWIQAIYRATGQIHKPMPPPNSQLARQQGGKQTIDVAQ